MVIVLFQGCLSLVKEVFISSLSMRLITHLAVNEPLWDVIRISWTGFSGSCCSYGPWIVQGIRESCGFPWPHHRCGDTNTLGQPDICCWFWHLPFPCFWCTSRAGSWLVRNNSSWRRGTSFYSCNKHLVEIFFFCPDIMAQLSREEIAFRNKRLNFVFSVLKTQVRYPLVLAFGNLLGGVVVLS